MRTLAANLVPFQAFRLKHPKPVWLNKEPGSSAGFNADVDQLLAEFAYATGSSLLPDSALDKQDSITVYAERYGGAGISKNGGGARCGNVGDWQVKGIGPNPLVGRTPEGVRDEKDDTWHSYGGLSLLDAIIKTINTVVVNEALPTGAVNCIGIIETGDDTAYQPGLVLEDDLSTGRGALLVRETTLRPAHLCPSENFTPKGEYKSLLESDVYRLRLANRELARELNHDGFVNFLAAFLKTSATQFAVGKMLRIYHGAVNTANIVADGRWLDLSTVCFVEANKNYFLQVLNSGFYSEHLSPLAIAKDVAYQYSKFNSVHS